VTAFDLIIFDCDGVLADSEVMSASVLVRALAPFGVELNAAFVFDNFVGASFPKVADRIRREFHVDLPASFEAGYREALAREFAATLRPTDGIHEVLARLTIPACVATSSSPPRVSNTLKICGFTDIFGADVFTASQVKHGKPAPDLFLFAARQMQTAPARCLVVEDSLPGIKAARSAGMAVWRYTGGAHLMCGSGGSPQTPAGIPVFDNWADFAGMLTRHERKETGHGQT